MNIYPHIYTHTHTHAYTHTQESQASFFFVLQQTHKALKLVISKGTATATINIISFWKLQQKNMPLAIMRNGYVYFLGYLTDL